MELDTVSEEDLAGGVNYDIGLSREDANITNS